MNQKSPNFYSGAYVDRIAHLRQDSEWLQAALSDSRTLFMPVWRSRNLITNAAEGASAVLLERGAELVRDIQTPELILLGRFREQVCFAYELQATHAVRPPPLAEFAELRNVGELLDPQEAGLLAYARAMVLWRGRHRFCGSCGSPTASIKAGHVLKCTNPECGIEQFPRLDPAIIVLVTDGTRALLGRQATWPRGRYSTIAGYVEPGESLEDAVRREVLEETGIQTGDIQYHSSQPWPFPASIMLGFVAHATSTDVNCVDDELEDVRWFTREQIASGAIGLPAPQSISLKLIEAWYDENAPRPLRSEPNVSIGSWTRR